MLSYSAIYHALHVPCHVPVVPAAPKCCLSRPIWPLAIARHCGILDTKCQSRPISCCQSAASPPRAWPCASVLHPAASITAARAPNVPVLQQPNRHSTHTPLLLPTQAQLLHLLPKHFAPILLPCQAPHACRHTRNTRAQMLLAKP